MAKDHLKPRLSRRASSNFDNFLDLDYFGSYVSDMCIVAYLYRQKTFEVLFFPGIVAQCLASVQRQASASEDSEIDAETEPSGNFPKYSD